MSGGSRMRGNFHVRFRDEGSTTLEVPGHRVNRIGLRLGPVLGSSRAGRCKERKGSLLSSSNIAGSSLGREIRQETRLKLRKAMLVRLDKK